MYTIYFVYLLSFNQWRFIIFLVESTRLRLWPYPNVAGSDYINANIMDVS